jgi:hypothetical protein
VDDDFDVQDGSEPDDEPEGVRKLRKRFEKQLKVKDDELAELRAYRQRAVIAEAGFDPSQGIVGLAAQNYQGEWTAEKFAEHARGLGLQPSPISDQTPTTPVPTVQSLQQPTELATQVAQPQLSPVEQARLAGQQRVDTLQSASIPDHTPTLAEQIAHAEANNDWGTSMRLKSQYMAEMRSSTAGFQ